MEKRRNILVGLAAGVVIALIILLVFFAGVLIGRVQQHRGFWPFWEQRHIYRDFIPRKLDGHGTIGAIDSLGTNTLVVKDRTGALKTVLVDNETGIRRGRTPIEFSDLKVEEQVVILGEPQEEEGVIKAKIIRTLFGKLNGAK